MQRNLQALSNQSFDLLVIGGGMHGACVAWEGILRGLSVALIEQADFASGTSANSLKVIHGGLRYLQTADFKRMRQSIKARQTLMRIAPHLVHPMPVLVPTYGHGFKGKEAMTVALKMNNLISSDRNLSLCDPQKHIPAGRILSKSACLEKLPDLPTKGLTGAALFHDAQAYNSEQLVLAFVMSAAKHGAQVANYVRAVDFETAGDRVTAANVTDQLTGDRFTIQAKTIVNASGPWVSQLLSNATQKDITAPLAKAMNLVTTPLFGPEQDCAVGITSREPGSRLFFIAPWRAGVASTQGARSLVGTWYGHNTTQSKPPTVNSTEVQGFLTEVNQAYPSFNLTPADVEWVHVGLLPGTGQDSPSGEVQLTKKFHLQDHKADSLGGLLSVTGVKYTTAQDIATKVLDWVFQDQNKTPPTATSSHTEILHGGHIETFNDFLATASQTYKNQIPQTTLNRLVYNYGSNYPDVLKHVTPVLTAGTPVTDHHILAAEVRYSLKTSMPQTLSDIIFRRTELGAAGHPGDTALQLCSQIIGDTLSWSHEKRETELAKVQQQFHDRAPQANRESEKVNSPCAV